MKYGGFKRSVTPSPRVYFHVLEQQLEVISHDFIVKQKFDRGRFLHDLTALFYD